MSSIFTDKQRDSLMESMINPESNARKMIEQNQEIGISPDITTEILNKYATYGANTGIGELGGGKLVDALNEEYRKTVDAPLREMSEKASTGRRPETLEDFDQLYRLFQNRYIDTDTESEINIPSGSAERALTKTELLQSGGFDPTEPLKAPSLNQPVVTGESDPVIDAALEDSKAADNAKQKAISTLVTSLGNILAQEIFNPLDEDPDPIIRAVKPKPFKTKQIRAQRIGMQDGGTLLNRKMFIGGGEVDGPGGPKEDLVPIWASDKEYVVSHKGVKRMGGGDFDKGIAALDRINFGK
tara:strand:- start:50 stop:946 length:897 start_codon:yes stop_codon:yes gene_type:complete